MNKILIIGNLGYIGPVLTKYFRETYENYEIHGFDTGFFEHCQLNHLSNSLYQADFQTYGDVRKFDARDLKDIKTIVYLAAISNDPMGNVFEEQTLAINHKAAIKIAKMAKENGVESFIFASSCSTYGFGGDQARSEQDEINPLTAYAKSKVHAEQDLAALVDDHFKITCLRFATACGASPRLRLDLVLNDFVASAITNGEITILSDGSPLRPLIDVQDMAKAIDWAQQRKGKPFLIVNAGCNDWNFSVREIAERVCAAFPNVSLSINQDAEPDKRSYKVDFSLYESLAGGFYPNRTLESSILEIADNIRTTHYDLSDFRKGPLMRLNVLKELKEKGRLDSNLDWV